MQFLKTLPTYLYYVSVVRWLVKFPGLVSPRLFGFGVKWKSEYTLGIIKGIYFSLFVPKMVCLTYDLKKNLFLISVLRETITISIIMKQDYYYELQYVTFFHLTAFESSMVSNISIVVHPVHGVPLKITVMSKFDTPSQLHQF